MQRESSKRTLIEKIIKLKCRMNAIILAHNYQPKDVQDIADFVADSLELARFAQRSKAEVIILCGVRFMAETAKVLCMEKCVILPDAEAACPLADMITEEDLRKLKREHEDAVIVCYVNSPVEVKALSHYCCTSRNAVNVVNAVPKERQIIFVPDKYLGDWVAKRTGRNLILWDGYCPTHMRIIKESVQEAKMRHPSAKVMVHPECRPEVRKMADKVCGTGGMLEYAKEGKEFIVGTEVGMIERLKREYPKKCFYPASLDAICPNMKLVNLEKILWALEDLNSNVKIQEDVAERARESIEKMLSIR
jgi:quinolinate synthase